MTDLELLFLVLAAVYLWECACWIPRGSIAFLTWTARHWRWAPGSASVGNQRGGFVLAMPLPPLGSMVTASPLPLSFSPEAVLAYVSTNIDPGSRPRYTGKLARFDQIKSVTADGRKLLIDGDLFLRAASSHYAAWLADKINNIRKAKPRSREAKISELFKETLDSSKVELTWAEFKRLTFPLRYLANGVFCYLFIFAPLIIYKFGLHSTWLRLLIGLFALTTSTALFFHSIHRKFYPKSEDDRFTHFLITMLSPATTPRAQDVLSRPLVERFHPLAVAKVFCSEEEFRNLAQRILLDLRNPALPVIPFDTAEVKRTEAASRALWQAALEEFLRNAGLDSKQLVAAPSRLEDAMDAYCPRCLAQFTRESSKCDDCGGMPLITFDESAKSVKPVNLTR